MRYRIYIPSLDGSHRCFDLLSYSDFQRIDVPAVVIFDIAKLHNHRYDLHGFFYVRKVIVGPYSFKSKKELHGAMQKLLQEYLHVDVQ